ncbi:hypothetical protein HCG51_02130 [Tolypothrix sp. PCC 7910]|uniref:hypothetical protein n=1 Tax=Tolypothrix sp. PCC 7910 TaxID=2099387 RepID=UPI0014278370|nr:hypothetical protein [Tolypothrix sp. PCC 7910]QIR35666.1 hypothetical protein HCG51_02130 [Tolypothrix sp. PCC 7910]
MTTMTKLYYNAEHESVPDGLAEDFALKLQGGDIVTSNYLVVLAAKVLAKEKRINPFTLVWLDGNEYPCSDNGMIENEPYFDKYTELLQRLSAS